MKIVNRKAYHDYFVVKEFIAGIKLTGSEVKSLREGNANMQDSYCFTTNGEVFAKGLYIAKHKQSTYLNHEEKRDRKLLLNKREIRNISDEVKVNQGMTIVPLEIFEMNGKFKLKICLAKGKKNYDKRKSLKEKDIKRQIKNYA
jgi:SsrA-binding protein